MLVPLLHAAQATAELVQVDRSVVASAAVALTSAVVAIWRPKRGRRWNPFRHRFARRRIALIAVSILVFLAVLPSVVPVDHIIFGHAETAAHEEIHTAHCHGSPGSCSDLPVVSGPGQLILSDPLIVVPAMLSVLLLTAAVELIARSYRPALRPPRPSATFT